MKDVNHLSYPENISKECSVSHWKYMLQNHAPMGSIHRLHHDLQIEPIFRSQCQAFQKTYLFHKVSSHNCQQACHIVIYCGLKGIINKMFLQCCQYWSSPKTDTINGFHAEACPFILRTGTWYSCCCCHKVIFLKEASCNSHMFLNSCTMITA